jgi:hypothetical protein
MKIYIGKPHKWFGPYQLAEKLLFWIPKQKDEYGFKHDADIVHNFGEWLAHGSIEPNPPVGSITSWDRKRHHTWLYDFLSWIDKIKNKIPKEYVKIDYWDTWSMDHTLKPIILPMLKQLKETKHGSQYVDMDDVPEYMRTTSTEDYDSQTTFDFYTEDTEKHKYDIHDRWDWVLDQMIFAFESIDSNWESQFESGEHDIQWKRLDNGMSQMIYGPNHTKKYDEAGRRAYQEQIDHGFMLFGKYFRGLWD